MTSLLPCFKTYLLAMFIFMMLCALGMFMLTCMYALISMPRCSFWYRPQFCLCQRRTVTEVARDGDNLYALYLCVGPAGSAQRNWQLNSKFLS